MRSFLAWHDIPFRKTHSLEEIGQQCIDLDPAFKDLIDQAVPLTEYAWKFRYPAETEEPTLEEARSALAISQKVCAAVLAKVPSLARP